MIVLFDGVCGLCHRSVRWLIRRDRERRLRFLAAEMPPEDGNVGTIRVRMEDGRELVRSEAVLACLGVLPAPWPMVARAFRWMPTALRDALYGIVARYRYRIWGRYETCPLPSQEERERFL